MASNLIYKALTSSDRAAAEASGETSAAVDLADGFVHLSSGVQLAETLRRHFKGETGIALYEFDPADFQDDLRWEPSRGGDLFPHLYGSLRIKAAKRSWILELGPDGAPIVPSDL